MNTNINKIGIICALDAECNEILNIVDNIIEDEIYDLKFYHATLGQKQIIITICGVGKINAARTTQIMIDKFGIDMIINFGSAGSITEELDLGDVVIANDCVQADADCTAFGTEKGKFQDEDELYIKLDKNIINILNEIISDMFNKSNYKIKLGRVATMDTFLTDSSMKSEIAKLFNADCVEMEGVSIANVASKCNIPCAIIRGISDKHNDTNPVDTYNNYKSLASKRCALIIKQLENKL